MTGEDYMDRALFHAARGRGRTSPNPMVGAVVVSPDGVVVGQGYHERVGEPHAEVNALAMAGSRAQGATLYCTLEPCCHVGRTGPCVARIVDAGIGRVVAAVEDPNPMVSGKGFAYLQSHGVRVDVGLFSERAIRLNQPFFTRVREGRPFVIMKAAISVDGCMAEAAGRRTMLTSAAANRHAHRVRAEVDAVAVGVGTIVADDPLLTARGPYRDRPLTRIVFDRHLRTPPQAKVLSTLDAGPVVIVTTEQGAARADRLAPLQAAGAAVEVVASGTVRDALVQLAGRPLGSVLIEGGAAIHEAAWDEGIVDFVRLYVTPRAIGAGGVRFLPDRSFSSAALVDGRIEPLGPDVLIEGYVHRPH